MASHSFVLFEEQINQINAALLRMIKKAEAKCALLVDKDGHLLTRQGFTQTLDTTALAALLAGSFASTKEIARLVGEPEFSVLFHQGKKDHIHISLVGERCILAVVFDDRTTIGMVRLYAKETGDRLKEILTVTGNREEPALDPDFTRSAGSKIDAVFKE
ncbi:MAG: roadblock/LC7 domain-containing protein [candidate division Zixibacteria bacterium]|nr:roadblock/LC7 domain-containing protein [candidate division Zixibacteria bacterium]